MKFSQELNVGSNIERLGKLFNYSRCVIMKKIFSRLLKQEIVLVAFETAIMGNDFPENVKTVVISCFVS